MGGEQMSDPEPTVLMASGFKAGQSDGGIGYEDEVAPTLNAAMSSLEPTVLAFSAGNSADAHGIGLTVEGTPPLRAAASGSNQVPTVLAFGHTQGLDLQVSSEATPTLRSKGDGAAVSTTAHVRRLTPLECERLMGWPDDHTLYRADGTVQPDSTRYRQCGNGVVANVAEWIAQQINRIVAS